MQIVIGPVEEGHQDLLAVTRRAMRRLEERDIPARGRLRPRDKLAFILVDDDVARLALDILSCADIPARRAS